MDSPKDLTRTYREYRRIFRCVDKEGCLIELNRIEETQKIKEAKIRAIKDRLVEIRREESRCGGGLLPGEQKYLVGR